MKGHMKMCKLCELLQITTVVSPGQAQDAVERCQRSSGPAHDPAPWRVESQWPII